MKVQKLPFKEVKEIRHNPIGLVCILNSTLLFMTLFLVIFYIIQANIVTANRHKINLLREDLGFLNETLSSLEIKKTSFEDTFLVLNFALSHNMVEAKDAVYLFEKGNVALRP